MDYEVSWSGRGEGVWPTVAAETLPINNGHTVPVCDGGLAIPRYRSDTYTWAYLNPRNVKMLDRELIVQTILWGQHRKLQRMAIAEIHPGSRVLQTACVYGDFSPVLARRIGEEGSLKVVDAAKVQVDSCA